MSRVLISTRTGVWILLSLLTGTCAMFYASVIGGNLAVAGVTGACTGAVLIGFEIYIVQGRPGPVLRRAPFPLFAAVTVVIWAMVIALALVAVPNLIGLTAYGAAVDESSFWQDFVYSFAVALAFNIVARTSSLVGHRVLANFLLGRYYRPLKEQRVFLFLDLKDSTLMAEQFGDIRVQTYIARFFADIAAPIARFGGETHRYIGDEIVVTWKLADAVEDARCIRCVMAIDELAARRAHWFEKHFGVAPGYRIGMHGGEVVVGEVGDGKREIVYFGGTINIAARLCQACKTLDRHFLVTESLLARIRLPENVELRHVGAIELAGIGEPVAVAEPLVRDAAPAKASRTHT